MHAQQVAGASARMELGAPPPDETIRDGRIVAKAEPIVATPEPIAATLEPFAAKAEPSANKAAPAADKVRPAFRQAGTAGVRSFAARAAADRAQRERAIAGATAGAVEAAVGDAGKPGSEPADPAAAGMRSAAPQAAAAAPLPERAAGLADAALADVALADAAPAGAADAAGSCRSRPVADDASSPPCPRSHARRFSIAGRRASAPKRAITHGRMIPPRVA